MSEKSIRLCIAFILLIPLVLTACKDSEKTCTVNHPIEDSAQLFYDPENNPDSVSMIPNGTECTYRGSVTYTEAGVEIPMYKLICDVRLGYMNKKWVDCY
jgi:hypothetical protein